MILKKNFKFFYISRIMSDYSIFDLKKSIEKLNLKKEKLYMYQQICKFGNFEK